MCRSFEIHGGKKASRSDVDVDVDAVERWRRTSEPSGRGNLDSHNRTMDRSSRVVNDERSSALGMSDGLVEYEEEGVSMER